MEGRDVDAGLAERRCPSAPMKPGLSWLRDVEHVRSELGLDRDALDLDQPRLRSREQRAGYIARAPLSLDRRADQGLVVRGAVLLDLGHVDVALAASTGAFTMLTLPAVGAQQPGQRHRGQRPRVEGGGVALVLDGHRLQTPSR